MSARGILEAYDRWRATRVPLVLVTVVDTEGSTYTKPGHRILMTGNGEFRGLVSGGCLEGDLAEHAREVLASGHARLLTYDLRDDRDDPWGLGIGCNGLFRVLLQPLAAEHDYAPFDAIAKSLRGDAPATAATVVESADDELPPGATVVAGAGTNTAWRVSAAWRARLLGGCGEHAGDAHATLAAEALDGRSARVLYAPLRPLPRLLVLGAGLDAVPLVEMARQLGWRVTVADHRPAYLTRGDLRSADQLLQVRPAQLGDSLTVADFSAAVVMSHHLETDRAWLESLAPHGLPYVGLLGPQARGERLLSGLGPAAGRLRPGLHSPVGLPIGADSPETIALAILAEIQVALSRPAGTAAASH